MPTHDTPALTAADLPTVQSLFRELRALIQNECGRGHTVRECWQRELVVLARVEAALPAVCAARMFPIQDGPAIPWAVIAPFEKQAVRNHGQTLERLAERGGLGVTEALWILTCKRYGDPAYDVGWTQPQRIHRLIALVAQYQSEMVRDLGPYVAAVQARIVKDPALMSAAALESGASEEVVE